MKKITVKNQTKIIMLVEDNPQDREAIVRILLKAGQNNPIVQSEDGDDALDYLFRRNRYRSFKKTLKPDLIFLDLNMPGTDGFDVLVQIKKDKELSKIPVVVLTTSSDQRDIEKCYAAGANSYVLKPVDLPKFVQTIKMIIQYWFEVVVLPESQNIVDNKKEVMI